MNEKMIARFWSKVDKGGPDDCWPWTGKLNAKGYGMFVDGEKWIGTANHISLELHLGRSLASGMQACHSCDDRYPVTSIEYRRCVNPTHLWEGTNRENQKDSFHKGRRDFRGEGCPRAKLSEADVQEIRATRGQISNRETAALYGVSKATISHIRTRRNWRHL